MKNRYFNLIFLLLCFAYNSFSLNLIAIHDTIITIEQCGKKGKINSYRVNDTLIAQTSYRKSIMIDSFYLEKKRDILVNCRYDKKGNISYVSEYRFDSLSNVYREIFRRDFYKNGIIKKEIYFNDIDTIKTRNISFTPKITFQNNYINVKNSFDWAIKEEKCFDKQGNLDKNVVYLSYLRNQTTKYYKNGAIKKKYFYIADSTDIENKIIVSLKPDSICIDYYKTGIIKQEITYNNGKRHGLERYYYENGNTKYERNFVDGVFQNPSIEWSENGQKCEVYYKIFSNGMPNTGIIIKRNDL